MVYHVLKDAKRRTAFSLIELAAALLAFATQAPAADWPQWRGPDRSNVSAESGLLKEWPQDGPRLAWKGNGLGDGVAPVAVAGGRVFTTGSRGDAEYCTALSAEDGRQLWTVRVGPRVQEMASMRWLAQRTPTVDRERIYVVTVSGEWACLMAETGKELWRKHFQKDFQGSRGPWGFCDYPLVDGDNLIITPGGEKATVAALNNRTGELVWTCSLPGGDRFAYAVLMPAEMGGVRQYVNHLSTSLIGVAAKDGKLLWKYDGMGTRIAATHAPIVRGDTVFYASGYGAGHVLLKIMRNGDKWKVAEVYRQRNKSYVSWLGSPTQVGDHIFLNTNTGMLCIERKSGQPVWEKPLGRCVYTVADGRLYIRSQKGMMYLAAADPKEYRSFGEFTPPQRDAKQPSFTFPVVANGHLFIRDFDTLLCYDVRDTGRPKRAPDAIFVPSPQDVVEKMLELANINKEDVVVDLGCGDGRILVTAAKKYGCKAVGYDIDEECVQLSRENVKKNQVEKLVRIEHEDIFKVDLSKADVVMLYLLPSLNVKLIPQLEKLKPGSRIVSHAFDIRGFKPDKVIPFESKEDGIERHLYLFTTPLKKDKIRH
jgi:outer membrane protein assembly factor BamB